MMDILCFISRHLLEWEGDAEWTVQSRIAAGVVAIVFFGWIGYAAWHDKNDFRITVRRGRVGFHGRFPLGRRADTTGFLLNDVAPGGTIRVIGNWSAGRVLRITVRGNISEGECQRIRNFLKITLNG